MTELRFAGGLPLWAVVSIALVLATTAWLLYRRELRTGLWGWALPTLRALAVLLIVLMLAGPELVHTSGSEQRGRVVLLVDRSASMGVTDAQMPDADRIALAQALEIDAELLKQLPRSARAERLLLDLDRGLLSALRSEHAVDIVELHGGRAQVLWSSDEDGTPPDAFTPGTQAGATDLGGYITRALDEAGSDVAGRLAFALLTDGRHNLGEPIAEAAARARAAGAVVHAIAVGSDAAPHDLALAGIDHPPSVFPDDRVTGTITLNDAMPAGSAYTLEVAAGDAVLWSQQRVTVGGGQPVSVGFDFPASEAVALARQQTPEGLTQNQLPLALTARVVGLEQDLEPRNNAMPFQVRAVTGTRRMLILAGRARWEMRYLDAMFTRDPRWEVTALMGGPGVGRRWPRANSGEAFPRTREALFGYDVIVMGELPAGTLSDGELQWVYDFVADRAGGLIVIDGRRGALSAYANAPIAPLLPTRLDGRTLRPRAMTLTDAGRRHPALRLEPGQAQNDTAWSTLPAPSFVAPIQPRAGIDEVLVNVSVGLRGEQSVPAVLTRRVGAGWVWYSAIDETWRWRRDVESLYQNRYWHQVTNRVVEPLYAAEDKYVSLGVDDAVVSAGGAIPVRVRLRDDAGRPRTQADASVYLETIDGERVARAPLSPDAVEGGRFTASLDAQVPPGVYRVGVSVAGVSDADLLATTLVTVRGTGEARGELADTTLDRDLLNVLTQTTGGRVFAEHQADRLPGLLDGLSESTVQQRVTVLWQGWPWFAAVVGLLALELALRRRLGML